MHNLLFDFLHNFRPQPIVLRLGFFNIHWYGCLIVLSIILGLILVFKLASKVKIKKQFLENLIFYLVIGGFIGARLYDVLAEFPYYLKNPLDIFKVWQGGLSIYGALIGGLTVLFFFSRKYRINFFTLADLLVPALALGQAIGRWGNYFNQEIFGWPTSLPWGIPIKLAARPAEFFASQYFHPCFLYESIWNFLVFLVLIFLRKFNLHKGKSGMVFALYLILYSFGRFFMEFLRIDSQPMWLGLRLGQITAILMFVVGWGIIIKLKIKAKRLSLG